MPRDELHRVVQVSSGRVGRGTLELAAAELFLRVVDEGAKGCLRAAVARRWSTHCCIRSIKLRGASPIEIRAASQLLAFGRDGSDRTCYYIGQSDPSETRAWAPAAGLALDEVGDVSFAGRVEGRVLIGKLHP